MQRVCTTLVWLLICGALYKYIYLEFQLVDTSKWVILVVVALLAALSFIFAGSETAIARITPPELLAWHDNLLNQQQAIERALAVPIFDNIRIIRTIANSLFYLKYYARVQIFIRQDAGVFVFDDETCLTTIVTCNNIININLGILLSSALFDSKNLTSTMPQIPIIGDLSFLNNYLPPGAAGFSSVGVTLILLIICEILAKKIAMHYSMRFLRISSYILAIINWVKIPKIFSRAIEAPINYFI